VQEAKKKGVAPDFLYCMNMLEETGIVTVPGSGFKQVTTPFCSLQ
jgi:alanine transaminase